MISFNISGKAMGVIEGSELYLDAAKYDDDPATPRATAALRSAERRRRGKGFSYLVTCDREAADIIRDYCATVGQGLMLGSSDDDARADGRALLATEERIRAAMAFDAELTARGI